MSDTAWNSVHLRSKESRYKSYCGMGYEWPSTIGLTDDPAKVTCGSCRKQMEE